jgi:two-component system sensor histidine kinase VicK
MILAFKRHISLPFGIVLLCSALLASCSRKNNDNGSGDVTDIVLLLNKAANQPATEARISQVHYIDSAIREKDLTISEKIRVYEFKAGIFTNQLNDYDRANAIADTMINLVESHGPEKYKTEYAVANYCKGDVLFNQKKYNDAYTHYYKARLIGKTNLDSCTLGEYSFRLALILYRQARYNEAAEKFRISFNESGTCNFDFIRYFRLQQVLNNTGLSFYKAGNIDSALHYYNKALGYIAEHRKQFPDRQYLNEIANAVIYGNLGDIYRIKGDSITAKDLLKKSIAINVRKGHDNMDAQYSQVKLADIYSDEGHIDSMYTVLQELRNGLDTIENTRAEMDWNRLMWKFYNKKNDARTAYNYLSRFTSLRDTLEKESNQLKTADLSQQIKMLENQYEIQALQKDNELKNVYLWIFILAIVFAGVILFLIFRNLKRSKKNITLLQSLNTQVNEQKIKLEEALSALEEKSRQQERILRAVAHDLRGPVATISMLCDLVLNEEDKGSRAEMVNFIQTSCNNSLDLIAEILEAADQSKRMEQEKESTNINQLIRATVELLQLKASAKDQKIVTELPKHDIFLVINADKIKRVISNLITNAIKFSPKGADISLRFTNEYNVNTIVVEDKGIGIPDEFKPKVFDMFTEAKRKGTAGELPYGLGLSICKQIIEAHNGNIWLESEAGKGTKFFVQLP